MVSSGIRLAGVEDAALIARQRGWMFRDMGSCSEVEGEAIAEASVAWFEGMLRAGEYVGWLMDVEGAVVAGAGVHLREMGPVPGMCCVGRWGHIANVFVDPEYRGRGMARSLLRGILEWAGAEGVGRLTLTASVDGEALYRSMGFTVTNDMQLLVPSAPGGSRAV